MRQISGVLSMPRFFLHIREGEKVLEDSEGQEFLSLDEARTEAVLSARELMAARMVAGRRTDHSKFEIVDASGHTVLIFPFEQALIEN
jgi:hypothetical protein